MGYAAKIQHKTGARARVQIAQRPDDEEAWNNVLQEVRRHTQSAKVRGNRTTRSLVFEAEDTLGLDEALRSVGEAGILELIEASPKDRKIGVWELPIKDWQEVSDQFLRQISEGRLDLRSTLGFSLLALGIRQSLKAKFLPAGLTLLIYALTFLKRSEVLSES